MPATSEAQRRAMYAAAAGRGVLGIPKAVAEEFIGKDSAGQAASLMLVAPDGDVLTLRRSSIDANWPGHWCWPGGKSDEGEGSVRSHGPGRSCPVSRRRPHRQLVSTAGGAISLPRTAAISERHRVNALDVIAANARLHSQYRDL